MDVSRPAGWGTRTPGGEPRPRRDDAPRREFAGAPLCVAQSFPVLSVVVAPPLGGKAIACKL